MSLSDQVSPSSTLSTRKRRATNDVGPEKDKRSRTSTAVLPSPATKGGLPEVLSRCNIFNCDEMIEPGAFTAHLAKHDLQPLVRTPKLEAADFPDEADLEGPTGGNAAEERRRPPPSPTLFDDPVDHMLISESDEEDERLNSNVGRLDWNISEEEVEGKDSGNGQAEKASNSSRPMPKSKKKAVERPESSELGDSFTEDATPQVNEDNSEKVADETALTDGNGLQWYDRDVFRCSLCGETSARAGSYRQKHKRECKALDKHPRSTIKFERVTSYEFKCQLCVNTDAAKNEYDDSLAVRHDLISIRHHLLGVHGGMRVTDYYNRFLRENVDCEKKETEGREEKELPLKEADVDLSWASRNLYRCLDCNQESRRRKFRILHEHKRRLIRASKEKYSCKLCSSNVSHNYDSIRQHMRRCHGVTLKEYTARHEADQEGACDGGDATSSQETENLNPESSKEIDLPASDGSLIDAAERREQESAKGRTVNDDLSWASVNLYRCRVCDQESRNRNFYKRHEHKGDVVRVSQERYSCKICRSTMMHNYDSIRPHMSRNHRLTLKEYSKRHECEGAASTKGDDSDLEKSEDEMNGAPNQEHLNGTMRSEDIISDEGNAAPEQLQHSPDDSDPVNVRRKGAVDLSWSWGTLYKCPSCNVCSRQPTFRRAHKCAVGPGKKIVVAGSGTYRCKICDAEMTHGYDAIRAHTVAKHGMILSKYSKLYEMQPSSQPMEDNGDQTASKENTGSDQDEPGSTNNPGGGQGKVAAKENTEDNSREEENDRSNKTQDSQSPGKLPHSNEPLKSAEKRRRDYSKKGVNDWASRNVFQCEYCGEESSAPFYQTSHSRAGACPKSPHENGRGRPRKMTDFNYACKVCGDHVSHDTAAICHHVNHKHGMRLVDYRTKYENAGTADGMETDISKTSDIPVLDPRKFSWANKNTFRCEFCSEESTDPSWMRIHSGRDQCSESPGRKKQGRVVRATNLKHGCVKCHALVLHDFGSIEAHARKHHGISMEEYAAQRNGKPAIKAEVKEEPIEESNPDLNWPKEGNVFECLSCKRVNRNTKWLRRHRDTCAGSKLKLLTSLNFDCADPDCDESLGKDYFAVEAHARTDHDGMSFEQYVERYVKKVAARRQPQKKSSGSVEECGLCGRKYAGLRVHVSGFHKLTWAEYERRSMRR